MRIFSILLVKDEIDIIRHSLADAARWSDRVFVLDNGSTDGTWEAVVSLRNDKIVPWKQDFRPYRTSLRAEVFAEFRHEARDGDWWCYKLDADEFYFDDPREFLAGVPRPFHLVNKKSIDYVLTHEDVAAHTFSGEFGRDRDKIRYFKPVAYTETRFFKHRSRLDWPVDDTIPRHCGITYPKPITVLHYQFRSPTQMQKRLDVRNAVPKNADGKPFRHIRERHWEELLASRKDMILDSGPASYRIPLSKPIAEPVIQYLKKRVGHGLGLWP